MTTTISLVYATRGQGIIMANARYTVEALPNRTHYTVDVSKAVFVHNKEISMSIKLMF